MPYATLGAVRIGFMVPQVFPHQASVDLAVVRTAVERAEAAGCHSLWTQSQLVGESNALEPLTLLSYVAALTSQVKLGTSVLIVPEHNPVQLAKQLASLDNLSGGRTVVGLGLGAKGLALESGVFDASRPVRRMIETVDIMKALWAEGTATFQGAVWQFDDVAMNPKPIQRPHPPLWLGGRHPQALRRSVRHGDGWMGPGAASTAEFAEDVALLRRALENAERDESSFVIAKRIYVAVEDNRSVAERRLQECFAAYGRDPARVSVACIYGSADDVREGLQEAVGLGAELIVMNPLYDFLRQQDALLGLIAE